MPYATVSGKYVRALSWRRCIVELEIGESLNVGLCAVFVYANRWQLEIEMTVTTEVIIDDNTDIFLAG